MIIIIFNLFIMIHDHNKIIINVGYDKITVTKTKLKSYENIILIHRWAEIELILDKSYKHDKIDHDKLITNIG
jgi:hypothetical protein